MTITANAARVDRREAAAERAQLRVWRPFPRKHLDVVCKEVNAPRVGLHLHEELQISLPITPLRMVDGTGRAALIGPGAVALTNPSELHATLPASLAPCRTRVLLIATETIARLCETSGGVQQYCGVWFPESIVGDDELSAELHALFDEMQRPLIAFGCETRVVNCLKRLIARCGAPARPVEDRSPRQLAGVRRVREYLRSHVAQPVSIDQLAEVADLSKYYLLRSFSRHYGISPHSYQMELRLARACTLLSRGVSPSYAAYEAGFADQSHLTRRMRATLGFTPGAYARPFSADNPLSPVKRAAPAIVAGLAPAAA